MSVESLTDAEYRDFHRKLIRDAGNKYKATRSSLIRVLKDEAPEGLKLEDEDTPFLLGMAAGWAGCRWPAQHMRRRWKSEKEHRSFSQGWRIMSNQMERIK